MDNETIITSGKTTIKHLLHKNTKAEHIKQTHDYLEKNLKRIKSTSFKLKALLLGIFVLIVCDLLVLFFMCYFGVFTAKTALYIVSLICVTCYFAKKRQEYKAALKEQIYTTYMYMLSNDIINSNLSVKNPEDNIFVDRFKASIIKNKLNYPINKA